MKHDILLTDDYELSIKNGDFEVSESDSQNINLILQIEKGQFRNSPLIGANITNLISGNLNYKLKDVISKEISKDGYISNMIYQDENKKVIVDFS